MTVHPSPPSESVPCPIPTPPGYAPCRLPRGHAGLHDFPTALAVEVADLRERVQRVLDWVGDCGCTCDAEPDTPLRDHDSLCPGYVEHMLTASAAGDQS